MLVVAVADLVAVEQAQLVLAEVRVVHLLRLTL